MLLVRNHTVDHAEPKSPSALGGRAQRPASGGHAERPASPARGPVYRLLRGAAPPARVVSPDDEQRRVIEHDGGPLLVLAGPGTGKTATLVEAVVNRVVERTVDPESILILTFSRQAAVELRTRITGRLGRTSREPLARTFHSYAFGLLRQQALARGEPAPRLLSGPEQDVVVRELLRGDLDDTGGALWPAELRAAVGARGFADELRDLLLRAVERGVDANTLSAYGRRFDRPDWVAAAAFLQQYEDVTALSGSAAYDPAELIRAALEALAGDPELLARERQARRRIFVDEYQDTDPAQEELLRTLAVGADELVVVGDPDQAIYAFRGADPTGITRFCESFARRDGRSAPSVALRSSRRCGPELLRASRRIAARLPGPAGHRDLRAASDSPLPPGTMDVRLLRSASEEATYIAHVLRSAHLRDGIPWREMAVLVRSTARSMSTLRRALAAAGAPVAVAPDELPLAQQPVVSALVLLVRVALGSVELDERAATALLTSAYGRADGLDLRRLRRELRAIDAAAAGQSTAPSGALLVEALRDPAQLALGDERITAPARRIAALLEVARSAAGEPGASAEDVLWAVWSASGLAAEWEAASRSGGVAGAAADRDLDAIVALFEAAARHVDRLPAAGPGAFVDHLAGQQIPGDTLAPHAPFGDAVRILTAHAAKGLQWRLVVVASVQEGSWPDLRRRGSLLGSELLVDVVAGVDPRTPASAAPLLAEERRLFYVAVTRARERLVVTAVDSEDEQPSRFLDELDPRPSGEARAITPLPRVLALPALVAELRSVVTDRRTDQPRREAAASQLARLAAVGVPGADPDSWWGLAPLSDERPLRLDDEQVRVSPSAVLKFQRCELRWLLEHAGGADVRESAQSLGMVIHDLIAWSTGDDRPSPGEVSARLDELLKVLDLGEGWVGRAEAERAHELLGKYLAWQSARGAEVVGAELEFEVRLGEHEVIAGRVDRVERDAHGRLVVIDFKTGKSAPAKDEVGRHPQLGAYQHAVEHGAFGESEVSGGAALVQLGTGKHANEQSQPPLRDDSDPGWAATMLGSVAAGMSGAAFRAVPSADCRVCPVRHSCPAVVEGRQISGEAR
jgi:superfamily I DNA/RNA helicase